MWFDSYWGNMPIDLSGTKTGQAKGLSKSKLAKLENNFEFLNWFHYLYNLVWGRFGYRNLEDTLDERNIERSMINYGKAGIARPTKDIKLANGSILYKGTPISPCFATGFNINMYGYPTKGWGWGMDGFNHEFTLFVPGSDDNRVLTSTASGYNVDMDPEAVIGYENQSLYPTVNYIYSTARRLADIWRAADVAVQNLKSPLIVRADETQKRTVEDMIRTRANNEISVVYMPNSVTADNFGLFPFQMDHQVLKEFREHADEVLAKFFEKVGFNCSPNSDKRERMLVDEVNANNDVVLSALMDSFHERELWMERCNNLWGTNYEVYIRGEEDAEKYEPDEIDDTDGLDSGERYDGNVQGNEPGQPDAGSYN